MTWKEGRKPQPGETRAEAAYLMERERERSAPSAKRNGRTDAKSNWTNVKIIDAQDDAGRKTGRETSRGSRTTYIS